MSSNVVAHLFWHDVKRNLRPIRALPLVLLALALVYKEVEGSHDADRMHVQGALTLYRHWLFYTIPLFAAAMGGLVAAERRAGITLSLLAKGVRRSDYVYARLLGAAASSALMTTASILGFYVIVSALWPMDRATWAQYLSPSPFRALYLENPLAHDMVCVSMYIAAAAALPLVGVLAGLLVANEYIAMVATPIFLIIFAVSVREFSELLNPERFLRLGYVDFWGSLPRWLIPFAPFLYWGVFSAIIVLICKRIIAKKEFA